MESDAPVAAAPAEGPDLTVDVTALLSRQRGHIAEYLQTIDIQALQIEKLVAALKDRERLIAKLTAQLPAPDPPDDALVVPAENGAKARR